MILHMRSQLARHLRAENRSDNTVTKYLAGARQAEAFLRARGKTLTDASRADPSSTSTSPYSSMS